MAEENITFLYKTSNIERFIAKAYIFLLTLRMISPFVFLQSLVHAVATDFDLILHIIGIFLILKKNAWKIPIQNTAESLLLRSFATMVLFFNISSLVMSCVMQGSYGNIGGETAFNAVVGMIIYWTQYIFIFYYNKEVFQIISTDELEKIIQLEIWCLLLLGYLQLAAMTFGGVIATFYNQIDIFNVFVDADNMSKLCLTGTEGASAASIIGIFVIPYLLSGIVRKKQIISEIIQILLWLPIIYATKSSSCYICVVASFPVFFIRLIRNGFENRNKMTGVFVFLFLIIAMYLFRGNIIDMFPAEIQLQLRYLLFEKVSDLDNGSTISRTVPLLTNWGAFTEYPIFGVGNGCQGYFYIKYFPNWALNVAGSDVIKFYNSAKTGIVNGAIFFPSILSGYGIVGSILFIRYMFKANRVMAGKARLVNRFADFYYIALIPIIVCGFQSEFAVKYVIWFVMSLPYMMPTELIYDDIIEEKYFG